MAHPDIQHSMIAFVSSNYSRMMDVHTVWFRWARGLWNDETMKYYWYLSPCLSDCDSLEWRRAILPFREVFYLLRVYFFSPS